MMGISVSVANGPSLMRPPAGHLAVQRTSMIADTNLSKKMIDYSHAMLISSSIGVIGHSLENVRHRFLIGFCFPSYIPPFLYTSPT